jgi:hypothetical protein
MVKVKKNVFYFLVCLLLLKGSFGVLAQERTLDGYIRTATSNSPLLKDLDNRLLSSTLDSAIIRAAYKPQLGVNSIGTYAPVVHGFGYDEAITNGQTLSALVTVNQQIFGRSKLNNELQSVGVSRDSIHNSVTLSQQDIRKTIISQYITAYTGQQQLELDKKVHNLLAEEELILRKLTQKNVYRQVDYLTFLVTMQQQDLQLKQNAIEALKNLAQLNYLAGAADADSVRLAEPQLRVTVAGSAGSIFLKQFRLDSIRIENTRKKIGYSYNPRVGIYADAGYNSSFIEQAYKNFGASAGFYLSIPVYDGHQRKLQYRKLDIDESTRASYRDYFLKQFDLQKAQLKRQLDLQQGLFTKINEQLRFIEGLIQADRKLLQTGDIVITDYVLAIRNYLETQSLLRQTNVSRLDLINQLNYLNQ